MAERSTDKALFDLEHDLRVPGNLEGILMAVPKVEFEFITANSGSSFGGQYQPTTTYMGPVSTLSIKPEGKDPQNVKFWGTVMPDSIGHMVRVDYNVLETHQIAGHKFPVIGMKIVDQNLGRTYSGRYRCE